MNYRITVLLDALKKLPEVFTDAFFNSMSSIILPQQATQRDDGFWELPCPGDSRYILILHWIESRWWETWEIIDIVDLAR